MLLSLQTQIIKLLPLFQYFLGLDCRCFHSRTSASFGRELLEQCLVQDRGIKFVQEGGHIIISLDHKIVRTKLLALKFFSLLSVASYQYYFGPARRHLQKVLEERQREIDIHTDHLFTAFAFLK